MSAGNGSKASPLIELRRASKFFGQAPGPLGRFLARTLRSKEMPLVRAVDQVDLALHEGEVVGLVGESGCGKSTLGRMAAFIHHPSEGEVFYQGRKVSGAADGTTHEATLGTQMVFQDPYASLNPRARVHEIVGEAPLQHGIVTRAELDDYVDAQLLRVGIDPAYRFRYPHQFSGGQRQRISIARALAVKPKVLVCDESVSALDVSVQAQILNLFMQLRADLGLSYLFISHDLSVVRHVSDRVAVMYLGRVVEQGPADELFRAPNHPYSRLLLAGLPSVQERHKKFEAVPGEIPSPLAPPPGCHFHTRCPYRMEKCERVAPALLPIAPGRLAACHLNTTE